MENERARCVYISGEMVGKGGEGTLGRTGKADASLAFACHFSSFFMCSV